MSVSKKNEKYYCRFQINGERHHYLCNGAKSMKEAKLIEDGFRYKIQQQQNGVIPKELEKVTLSKLTKIFLEYSEDNLLNLLLLNLSVNVFDRWHRFAKVLL